MDRGVGTADFLKRGNLGMKAGQEKTEARFSTLNLAY